MRAARRLLFLLTLLVATTARAADPEPYAGCLLAAANEREVLRAYAYRHPAIPARILILRAANGGMGHAALVYRLDPEGWMIYDDTFGSRPFRLLWPCATTFPPAYRVARLCFPSWSIGQAWWMERASR